MRTYLVLFLLWLIPLHAYAATGTKGYVVLLHGLARTSHSMKAIDQALQAAGYETISIDYPSRNHPIDILATQFVAPIIKARYADTTKPLYAVTHSMGGIVLRAYVAHYPHPSFTRIVMLAPPNQGSEVADYLHDNWLFQSFYGPAGQQLGTHSAYLANLPVPATEIGVIAGDSTINPLTSFLMLEGEDDGAVSVARTKVKGMKDSILLDTSHSLMMYNTHVIEETLYFLAHGRFQKQ